MLLLKRNADFRRVFDQGKSAGGHFAVLYALYSADEPTRCGFIASKKAISNRAVDRNRARRRLKEAVRRNLSVIPPGYQLVFICRRPLLSGNFADVVDGVRRSLAKTKVVG